MESFEKILLRFKEQMAVPNDKDVAALLGLSVKAFTARKMRGAFPTDKLLALKASRPELGVDDSYILTGIRQNIYQKINDDLRAAKEHANALMGIREPAPNYISENEQQLLELFRKATQVGKEAIIATAKAVEKVKTE